MTWSEVFLGMAILFGGVSIVAYIIALAHLRRAILGVVETVH